MLIDGLAEDYADNCHTWQLRLFINNEEELTRINEYRNCNMSQEEFNKILRKAIAMREEPFV